MNKRDLLMLGLGLAAVAAYVVWKNRPKRATGMLPLESYSEPGLVLPPETSAGDRTERPALATPGIVPLNNPSAIIMVA